MALRGGTDRVILKSYVGWRHEANRDHVEAVHYDDYDSHYVH